MSSTIARVAWAKPGLSTLDGDLHAWSRQQARFVPKRRNDAQSAEMTPFPPIAFPSRQET